MLIKKTMIYSNILICITLIDKHECCKPQTVYIMENKFLIIKWIVFVEDLVYSKSIIKDHKYLLYTDLDLTKIKKSNTSKSR